jgi:hypothetical protein
VVRVVVGVVGGVVSARSSTDPSAYSASSSAGTMPKYAFSRYIALMTSSHR